MDVFRRLLPCKVGGSARECRNTSQIVANERKICRAESEIMMSGPGADKRRDNEELTRGGFLYIIFFFFLMK